MRLAVGLVVEFLVGLGIRLAVRLSIGQDVEWIVRPKICILVGCKVGIHIGLLLDIPVRLPLAQGFQWNCYVHLCQWSW